MVTARLALAALGGVASMLVGACGSAGPVAIETAPGSPTSTPTSGLAEFYGQHVQFEPCTSYAKTTLDEKLFADRRYDCARVQVPVDYADPTGPRGEIALLRVKARGERIGSLLVNPGGPGVPGMGFVALEASDVMGQVLTKGPVGERFDVIGFDPRGVGASTPRADCYTDAETDRGEGFLTNPVPNITDAQQAQEVARRCAEHSGGEQALVNFGSRDTVRDMDVLRAALGDEKLSYLGYSYGTEIGAMYAETFPQTVRAVALDGAVDPDMTAAQFRLSQYVGFQKAFTAMSAACASQPDCPLGADPARANEEFQAIVGPLLDHPAPTTDPRGLTYDDAVAGVMAGLYSDAVWPKVIDGLRQLVDGRGDELLKLRDNFLGRDSSGRYSTDPDSNVVIRCMDNPQRTPAQQAELTQQIYDAAPFLNSGRPAAKMHYECEAWPQQPSRPERWVTGKVDVPPTLTVAVTGDPATPQQGGINLARTLKGSLLTVDGAQHGIALLGQNQCVDDIVANYLVNLQTPPADAHCTR